MNIDVLINTIIERHNLKLCEISKTKQEKIKNRKIFWNRVKQCFYSDFFKYNVVHMNIYTLVDDICKRHRHNAVKRVNHKTSFFKFLSKHPFYIGTLIGCILVVCVCGYSFLHILPFIVLAIIYTLNVVLKNK